MAFTNITKPTAGNPVSKADFGDKVVDNFTALYPDVCITKRVANQTIPNNTETTILWTDDRTDTSNMHSTSSNTEWIYYVRKGIYLVQCVIQFTAHATGFDTVILRDQAGNTLTTEILPANSSIANTFNIVIPTIITGTIGTLGVKVVVKQTSGGNLDVTYDGAGTHPNFSVYMLKDLST